MNKPFDSTYTSRWKKFRKAMRQEESGAFMVSSAINLRYLTSMDCSFGHLLCFPEKSYIITDGRYTADARQNAHGVDVVELKGGANSLGKIIQEILSSHGVSNIFFEASTLTVRELELIKSNVSKKIKFKPSPQLIEKLRLIKDADEIQTIKTACEKTDASFKKFLTLAKPGMTEKELRTVLDIELLSSGVEKTAFDSIVASGPNGAFAHAKPSDRKIRKGDFIVLDFGVRFNGYHSDMTRTVFVGTPDREHKARYNAVNDARRFAIEAAMKNVSTAKVDAVAREHLESKGHAKYFIHGLGHGVGLEVHEEPRVSGLSKSILKPGMIITIEPGIYIESWGGIRIEDTCVITEKGCVPLTCSSRKLTCI